MVYIFLADGFEDIEAIAPLDILRRAKIETRTVGVTGMSVTTAHGLTVQADCALDEVDIEKCEMLVLPGGGKGTENLKASPCVNELVRQADENGKLIAAICAAPTIFAELGLLKGRRAVCFPSMESVLEQNGARIQRDESVTHDGHIITARAAGVSLDFGLLLVSMLRGWAASDEIRKSLHYNPKKAALT